MRNITRKARAGLRRMKQEMNFWPRWSLGHLIIPVPDFLICGLSLRPPGEPLCLFPWESAIPGRPQQPAPLGRSSGASLTWRGADFRPAAPTQRSPGAWWHSGSAPDLDKLFLSGMQKCFSHPPLSSLFIPTVVVSEWKVIFRITIL